MKVSDILRLMAAAVESDGDSSAFKGHLEPVELADQPSKTVAPKAGKTASGNDKEPDLFLPPLQQKQELLKKAVGVENVYDDGTPEQQEIERESKEGPWSGPEHEYDYVGAPDSQGKDADGDDTTDGEYGDSVQPEQDEVQRLRKNAGMKVNPVVLSALSDDEPTE